MRFFGGAKPKVAGPSLEELSGNVDKRIQTLDERIKRLDGELFKYREQMKKMRPGPSQNALKKEL